MYAAPLLLDFKGWKKEHGEKTWEPEFRVQERMKKLSFASAYIAGCYPGNEGIDSDFKDYTPTGFNLLWAGEKLVNLYFKSIPSVLMADQALRLGLPAKAALGIGSLPLAAEFIASTLDVLSISLLTESTFCVWLRDRAVLASHYVERGAWGGLAVSNVLLLKNCRYVKCAKDQELRNTHYLASAVFSTINFCYRKVVAEQASSYNLSYHLSYHLSIKQISEKNKGRYEKTAKALKELLENRTPLNDKKWDEITPKSILKSGVGEQGRGAVLTTALRNNLKSFLTEFNKSNTIRQEIEYFKKICKSKGLIKEEKFNDKYRELQKAYLAEKIQEIFPILCEKIINLPAEGEDEAAQLEEQVEYLQQLLLSVQGVKELLPPKFIEEKLGDKAKEEFLNKIKSLLSKSMTFECLRKVTDLIKAWEEVSPPKDEEGCSTSPLITFLSSELKKIPTEIEGEEKGRGLVSWAYTFRTLAPYMKENKVGLLTNFLEKQSRFLLQDQKFSSESIMHLFITFNILMPLLESDGDLKSALSASKESLFGKTGSYLVMQFKKLIDFDSENLSSCLEMDNTLRKMARYYSDNGFLDIEIDKENSYFPLIKKIYDCPVVEGGDQKEFEVIEAFISLLARVNTLFFKLDPEFTFDNEPLKSSEKSLVKELKEFIRRGFADKYDPKSPEEQFIELKDFYKKFCKNQGIQLDPDQKINADYSLKLINKDDDKRCLLLLAQAYNDNSEFDYRIEWANWVAEAFNTRVSSAFRDGLDRVKEDKHEIIKLIIKECLFSGIDSNTRLEFFNFLIDKIKNNPEMSKEVKKTAQLFVLKGLSDEINKDLNNKISSDPIDPSNYLKLLGGDIAESSILQKLGFKEDESDPQFSKYVKDQVSHISFVLRLSSSKSSFSKEGLKNKIVRFAQEKNSLDWIFMDRAFRDDYEFRGDLYKSANKEERKHLIQQCCDRLILNEDTGKYSSIFRSVLATEAEKSWAEQQKREKRKELGLVIK